jgi:hypothetical protein
LAVAGKIWWRFTAKLNSMNGYSAAEPQVYARTEPTAQRPLLRKAPDLLPAATFVAATDDNYMVVLGQHDAARTSRNDARSMPTRLTVGGAR